MAARGVFPQLEGDLGPSAAAFWYARTLWRYSMPYGIADGMANGTADGIADGMKMVRAYERLPLWE